MKKVYFLMVFVCACFLANAQNGSPYWSLSGNSNASGTSKLGTTNSTPLRLFTNNTERMRVDAGGNIGIGTTVPKGKLGIQSSGGTPASIWVSSGVPLFAGFGENTPGNADDILAMASNTANARAVFLGRKSRGTLAFPTAVQSNDYIMTFYASAYDGGGTFQAPATIDFLVDGTVSSGIVPARISLSTGSSFSNRTERLRIGSTGDVNINSGQFFVQQSSGYVGIGTVSPSYLLDVRKTGSYYGIYAYGSYTAITGIAATGSSGGYGIYGYGDLGVYGYGTTYGIFGSAPSGAYAGYFAGNVFTTGSYSASDQKFKQNIKDASSGLAIISQLKPKSYEYKHEGMYKEMNLPTGEHYGLIAQEVEKVLPNLVKNSSFESPRTPPGGKDSAGASSAASTKKGHVDFKAVNYTELIPILVKAVQEQQSHIQQQDSVIAALQTKVASLTGESTPVKTGTISQNMPNPGSSITRIAYHVPDNARQAQLVVFDAVGSRVQVFSVKGMGTVNVNTTALTSGIYHYSLIVDNTIADTKQMIIAR